MSLLSSKRNLTDTGIRTSPPSSFSQGSPDLAACPVGIAYVPTSQLEGFLKAHEGRIIALVSYGSRHDTMVTARCPWVHVDLQQLSDPKLTEVWTSALPVSYRRDAEIACSFNDEVLWGCLRLDESGALSLDALACSAYRGILNHAVALGYPHLLRMWNYFPAINAEDDGLERYKRFCVGRYQAFSERQIEFKRTLPAATAVGTPAGPLQVHFLAGRRPGVHIENPRQISAYEYPPIHGPRAPSFSRGTLNTTETGQQLFIAGTSSIVGHASYHVGNPRKQTIEALRNIEALITQVDLGNQARAYRLADHALLKVYVRYTQHGEAIQETMADSLGLKAPILYLQGDICRSEMLLEIEGILTMDNR